MLRLVLIAALAALLGACVWSHVVYLRHCKTYPGGESCIETPVVIPGPGQQG